MSKSQFYEEMRQKADPLWQAIFEHPFVTGIGDGTLSRDRFEFYLKQDYVYLIDFSRVFALASVKSWNLQDMGTFATLLNATLNMEMELHRKTCAAFGIPAQDLEKTRKSMITSAYTNLLVQPVRHPGGPGPLCLRLCRDRSEIEIAGAPGEPILPGLDPYLFLPGIRGIRRLAHPKNE
jgi:thiaminase/transcriptional activator TenA